MPHASTRWRRWVHLTWVVRRQDRKYPGHLHWSISNFFFIISNPCPIIYPYMTYLNSTLNSIYLYTQLEILKSRNKYVARQAGGPLHLTHFIINFYMKKIICMQSSIIWQKFNERSFMYTIERNYELVWFIL